MSYVWRQTVVIVRVGVIYRPFRSFASVGLVVFLMGSALLLRFIVLYFSGRGQGNIQSLILAGALITVAFQTFMTAFLADAIASNRHLSEHLIDLHLRPGHFGFDPKSEDPRDGRRQLT